MESKAQIKYLVDQLGSDKADFLSGVEFSVKRHITDKSSKDCLTFVQLYDSGSTGSIYRPEATIEYLNCLRKFCSGDKFKGYALDSYLTEGVVSKITSEFQLFYEGHSDKITASIVEIISKDKIFLNTLAEQVFEYSKSDVPKFVRNQAASLLISNLEQVFDTSISKSAANVVSTVATKTIAATVGAPIAQQAATIVVKFLTLHFKTLIVAALKSTAVKAIVAGVVKKFAAGAILAAIVKIVGAKLALGGAATFAWVVLPILAAYIAYEAYALPEKLGTKVSPCVRIVDLYLRVDS